MAALSPWNLFMARCTRELFPNFDISHWPDEALARRECVTRLMHLKCVHKNLLGSFFKPVMRPEDVFRYGLITQLIGAGETIYGNESITELKARAKAEMQRREQAVASFNEVNGVVLELQAIEMREFLSGIDFE